MTTRDPRTSSATTCSVSACTRASGHEPPHRNGFTGDEFEISARCSECKALVMADEFGPERGHDDACSWTILDDGARP